MRPSNPLPRSLSAQSPTTTNSDHPVRRRAETAWRWDPEPWAILRSHALHSVIGEEGPDLLGDSIDRLKVQNLIRELYVAVTGALPPIKSRRAK